MNSQARQAAEQPGQTGLLVRADVVKPGHAGRERDRILRQAQMHVNPKSPANTIRLMEEVCERENLLEALRRVKGQQR